MSLPFGASLIVATPEQLASLIQESVKKALADIAGQQQPIPPEFQLSDALTRQQVKEYLNVSYVTLGNWSKATADRPAILVPFKVGERVRYRRDDVLAVFKETRRYKDRHAD